MEYLCDARIRIEKCAQACRLWQYPYDGVNPAPTSLNIEGGDEVSMATQAIDVSGQELNSSSVGRETVDSSNIGIVVPQSCDTTVDSRKQSNESAIFKHDISNDIGLDDDKSKCVEKYATEEEFIQMLDESGSPGDKSINIEDSIKSLDAVLTSLSTTISYTSTPRKDAGRDQSLASFGAREEMSTVYYDCESSQNPDESDVFKSINDSSFDIIDAAAKNKTEGDNATEFDIIDSRQMDLSNNNNKDVAGKPGNATSFVEVSSDGASKVSVSEDLTVTDKTADGMLISFNHFPAEKRASSVPTTGILVSKQDADDGQGKGDKSVRFSETAHVQTFGGLSTSKSLPVMGVSTAAKLSSPPNIGRYLMLFRYCMVTFKDGKLPS